jgi:hypothetical protein
MTASFLDSNREAVGPFTQFETTMTGCFGDSQGIQQFSRWVTW